MDLFSTLYRWAHRQGENFTTDAFVFLLKHLLKYESDLGKLLVDWLCFGNEAGFDDLPTISTQQRVEDGTPDIEIRTSKVLVLIEVKKGSDLHVSQLQQYHNYLTRQQEHFPTRRLVLLTVFAATYDDAEKPDRSVRWADVERWLTGHSPQTEVGQFLVGEFVRYLEGQVMTVEKVEWQYVEGVKSLCRFTNMLETALANAGNPKMWASSLWSGRGFYTKGKQFWVGVYLDSPEILRFRFEELVPDSVSISKSADWRLEDGKYVFTVDLSSEPAHFFSRTKEQQLDFLTKVLKQAHSDAMSHVTQGTESKE